MLRIIILLVMRNPGLSAVARDSEGRGSKSHLAVNSGIHLQERRGSRNAVEKQVSTVVICKLGIVFI